MLAVRVPPRIRQTEASETPTTTSNCGTSRCHPSGVPLCTGEHEYTKFGVRDLLVNEAVDVVHVDIARTGGFTECLKIAGMTQAWNVKFAPHAMEHIHSHLVSASHNSLFVERLTLFEEITHKIFANAPVPVNGYLPIPDGPGLGLELNMDFIRAKDEV
jgi:L-alanine-DL-glutamate epimerase-like enolase superfamily enzyme